MIGLTSRLNERDETILHHQQENAQLESKIGQIKFHKDQRIAQLESLLKQNGITVPKLRDSQFIHENTFISSSSYGHEAHDHQMARSLSQSQIPLGMSSKSARRTPANGPSQRLRSPNEVYLQNDNMSGSDSDFYNNNFGNTEEDALPQVEEFDDHSKNLKEKAQIKELQEMVRQQQQIITEKEEMVDKLKGT